MSELEVTAPTPTHVPVDTSDNTPVPVEKSAPKEEAPPEVKKPDLETAIKTAFERSAAQKAEKESSKAKDDAPVEKPKVEASNTETPEAKAARERAPDGKFAPKEGAVKEPSAEKAEPADGSGQDGKADARPSEGKDYTKPPAHFLPRAKEAWSSASPDVQREVHRMRENYENGMAEYKESHENWSKLREFDQQAKAAGTTVPDYIRNVRAIEQLIQSNPVEGIKRVLATANITPEQYARHILGQQQEQANPQAQQTNQLTQTMQQMAAELQQMRQREQQREEEARLNAIADKFIAPFKTDHPRYDELEDDIAFFLNSGKIPSNLSERERLETAYDMAERINPAPKFNASAEPGTQASTPRPLDPAGLKSVTGSPNPGLATTRAPGKGDAQDLDAILRRSLAKATAR